MKKVKTIVFSVAVVLVSLFLCSAGCQNAADSGSSGGGGQQGDDTSAKAKLIAKINQLTDSSAPITVTVTDEHLDTNYYSAGSTEKKISEELIDAIRNAPAGKINLDLVTTQLTDYLDFSDCSSLRSVTIPSSVTGIKSYAFSGCSSLTSMTIPSSVTWIGFMAFSDCSSLTSLTVLATDPPDIDGDDLRLERGAHLFERTPIEKIYVPNIYTYASPWRYHAGKLKAIAIPNS